VGGKEKQFSGRKEGPSITRYLASPTPGPEANQQQQHKGKRNFGEEFGKVLVEAAGSEKTEGGGGGMVQGTELLACDPTGVEKKDVGREGQHP